MEIREAAIAAIDRASLEELIDRAVRPDVPLRVLFAALDRYTELLRPALDDEPAPTAVAAEAAEAAATAEDADAPEAMETESGPMVLPVTPGPHPAGPPGPPE